MSQDIFDDIDPADSGTDLAGILNLFKDAVASGFIGTSRPANLQAGGGWVDSTNDPDTWTYKIYTGSSDIDVFTVDLMSSSVSVGSAVSTFTVKRISDDSVGAIMELVKRRAGDTQVHSGDTVGEIRLVGRDDAAGNPVVAKIVFVASEAMTSSASGGSLDFYATPQGSATIVKHMRFIGGQVETLVPHLLNSQVLVSQNVATASSINQMDGSKVVVEMTGSTNTDVRGINSAHDSKVVTIHNRSTAFVAIKHENASASAADRFKLPGSADLVIPPAASATFVYNATDSRWKLLSSTISQTEVLGPQVSKINHRRAKWMAPSGIIRAKVLAFKKTNLPDRVGFRAVNMLDRFGSHFAWGNNSFGEHGDGGTTTTSTPTIASSIDFVKLYTHADQVSGDSVWGLRTTGYLYAWGCNAENYGLLGTSDMLAKSAPTIIAQAANLKFVHMMAYQDRAMALTPLGTLYAWGLNNFGTLGNSSTTNTSSPVAVAGGNQFRDFYIGGFTNTDSKLEPLVCAGVDFFGNGYMWGGNVAGALGNGDLNPRSAPTAVLGSLKWQTIWVSNAGSVYGLTEGGLVYAWGINTNGQLGLGDVNPRSSPVAILGGLTFQKIAMNNRSKVPYLQATDGTWYTMGDATVGLPGHGDNVPRSSPVAIAGGYKFKDIVATPTYAGGVLDDGTGYMWGNNSGGCLGVNDLIGKSSPTAIAGGYVWDRIIPDAAFSFSFTCFGVTKDGSMYGWGLESLGMLGNGVGTVLTTSSPTLVASGFATNPMETPLEVDVDLVPGTTYDVALGPNMASFGTTLLGTDVARVEIHY